MSEHRTVNMLPLTCRPEWSEGSHIRCAKHANVPGVSNYPAGGPSVRAGLAVFARLGMTAV